MAHTENKSLLQLLKAYAVGSNAPLHMPGHKRNTSLLGNDLPYAIDLTEIDGFDNLHEATGVLQQGMERAADLYGSNRTFYLVGGSTAGILAGIRAATRPGDRVLVGRNCHKSVYHALELCRLQPRYLMPPTLAEWNICGSISPTMVKEALSSDIRLVVLTSPTYEGVLSDIASIARLCHEHGIPLLVDQAHGAHLGFGPFPSGAVAADADVVVHSLHKTLPSLTQTGLIHVDGSRIDPSEVERQLAVFQTSSPSYPLMASIDQCVRLMAESGPKWMTEYANRLENFDRRIACLQNLRVLGHTGRVEYSEIFDLDPGKLFISCQGMDYDQTPLIGVRLAALLRSEYRIETEMASTAGVLAMTSLCDTKETLERLAKALCAIDRNCTPRSKKTNRNEESSPLPPLPEQIKNIEQALLSTHTNLPLEQCVGQIAAEYVWAYPPGIPLLVPGEQITDDFLGFAHQTMAQGIALHSTSRGLPATLRTCQD